MKTKKHEILIGVGMTKNSEVQENNIDTSSVGWWYMCSWCVEEPPREEGPQKGHGDEICDWTIDGNVHRQLSVN